VLTIVVATLVIAVISEIAQLMLHFPWSLRPSSGIVTSPLLGTREASGPRRVPSGEGHHSSAAEETHSMLRTVRDPFRRRRVVPARWTDATLTSGLHGLDVRSSHY
jgi:hypothetical protein